jgi:hypothetical protein
MKKLLLFLWTGIAVAGCNSQMEEEISWGLDEYPDLLVVEGSLTNETKHHVISLSLTGPYFETTRVRPVTDALVQVSDGTNTFVYTESEINRGTYVSDSAFAGKPLVSYSLDITLVKPLNGISHYTATSVMPEGIEIDTILCEIYELPDLGFPGESTDEEKDTTILSIYMVGKEPENPDNFYLASIFQNEIPWQPTSQDLLRFTDDYSNGLYSDYILFAKNVGANDTIRLKISSVENSYYDYIGSIQQMEQSGSAYNMSGPPANAIGNVQNALGYFYATYISEKTSYAIDKRKF